MDDYDRRSKELETQKNEKIIRIQKEHGARVQELEHEYKEREVELQKGAQRIQDEMAIYSEEAKRRVSRRMEELETETEEKDAQELVKRVEFSRQIADAKAEILNVQNILEITEKETRRDLEKKSLELAGELHQIRQTVPQKVGDVPFSWDQLGKLKDATLQAELKEKEMELAELERARRRADQELAHDERKCLHDLQRETTLDELKFQLIAKMLEREILMVATRLQIEDKESLVKTLGTQISKSLGAAKDMVSDLKIVGLPGDGDGFTSFLNGLTKNLFKIDALWPTINEVLSEHGVHLFDKKEMSGSSKVEDTAPKGGATPGDDYPLDSK